MPTTALTTQAKSNPRPLNPFPSSPYVNGGVNKFFKIVLPNWRVVQNYYTPNQEIIGPKYRIDQ
jgi:hypothetical protein